MTHDELAALIARLSAAGIGECEYKAGETEIRVSFERERRGIIRSDETGIFHSKHPLGGEVSVCEGELAVQGQIIAYLRKGTVLRPVIAPFDGRVRKQLLHDGAAAGHGDPLYLFEAAGVSSTCRRAFSQSAPTESRGPPGPAS